MSKKKAILIILAVALLCAIAVTGTLAYLTATTQKPVVNTFMASSPFLAGEFNLVESKVAKNGDGSYSFAEPVVEVLENTYDVIPSTDLPKDPFVRIIDKSEVPAYLYVEVVDGLADSGLTYTMASCWTKLDNVTGLNGGAVYVYKNGELVTEKTEGLDRIDLLADNKIHVADELHIADENGIALKFYGYLAQASAGDAATAFGACFKKN